MSDPFSLEPKGSNEPSSNRSSRRRLWAVLLVLDTILVCIFGGALVGMLVLNGSPRDLLKGWFEPPPPVRAVPRHNATPTPPQPTPPAPPAPPAPLPPPPPPPSAESQLQEPQKAKKVEFICSGKGAKRVYLKGPFIRTGRRRMKKSSDGQWRLTLYLNPGSYKYYCSLNGKDSDALTMDVAP